MRTPKAVRASLKALWREFNRCSNQYPPLYHEMFMHSYDLTRFDVGKVCESFRRAFHGKFGEGWEEWSGTKDCCVFGRFFGDGKGIEEFKRLAESAYLVVCEIDAMDVTTDSPRGYTRDWEGGPLGYGYYGWLRLLHDMAHGYPPPVRAQPRTRLLLPPEPLPQQEE